MPGLIPSYQRATPYYMPTTAIAKPQFNISIPRLPDDEDENDDEPTEDPNTSKTEQSEPSSKSASKSGGSNIWGTIGKDTGIGAGVAGTAGAIGKGAYDLTREAATKSADVGKWGLDEGEKGISEVLPDAENVGEGALKIGAGMGEGAETLAPVAAATEAIGGGPEDPIADIAAGAEEVGGALGGGAAAAVPMIAGVAKNLFSLAA